MELREMKPEDIKGDEAVDNGKDLVGFSLKRDFDVARADMNILANQFNDTLEKLKEHAKKTTIGAFVTIAFGIDEKGDARAVVSTGGTNLTNLFVADFVYAIYQAQMKASGFCPCPSCYLKALATLKDHHDRMEAGSAGQVKH